MRSAAERPAMTSEELATRLRTELALLLPLTNTAPTPEPWATTERRTISEIEARIGALQDRLRQDCASPRSASPQKHLAASIPAEILARLMLDRLFGRIGKGDQAPAYAVDGSEDPDVSSEPDTTREPETPSSTTPILRRWRPIDSFAAEAIALGDAIGALYRIGGLSVGLKDKALRALRPHDETAFPYPLDPLDPFWSPKLHYRVGAMLLSTILPVTEDDMPPPQEADVCRVWMPSGTDTAFRSAPLGYVAVVTDETTTAKPRKMIFLSPPAVRLARRIRRPFQGVLLPLPMEPLDWKDRGPPSASPHDPKLERPAHYRYQGGYLALRRPLIRADAQIMTDGLDAPCDHLALDAVNALQRVAFSVDRDMLQFIRNAISFTRDGLRAKSLPETRKLHWQAALLGLDPEADYPRNRRELLALIQRFMDWERALDRLERLAAYPNGFHQTYRIDYRGRLYPDSPVSHQGNHIVRACIRFRDGAPLGEQGLRWLKVYIARLSGQLAPTASEAEALEWVKGNFDMIVAIGDPNQVFARIWNYKLYRFIRHANDKKRLLFMAACKALSLAMRQRTPSASECSIPLYLDGSANILQHFAMMTRDERLATEFCNLDRVPLVREEQEKSFGSVSVFVKATPYSATPLADPYANLWQGAKTRLGRRLEEAASNNPKAVIDEWLRDKLADADRDTPDTERSSMIGAAAIIAATNVSRNPSRTWSAMHTPFGSDLDDTLVSLGLSNERSGRKLLKTVLVRRLYGGTRYGVVQAIAEGLPELNSAASRIAATCVTRAKEAEILGDDAPAGLERQLAWRVLAWLGDEAWEAFRDVAPRATAFLDALRMLAAETAKSGRSLIWSTPAGVTVHFAPRKLVSEKVTTGRGGISTKLTVVDPKGPIDARRLVNGIAANVVHSMDAAHAMLVAVATRHAGGLPIMPIHDAFGVRPADAETLVNILTATFFRLYERIDAETILLELVSHSGLAGPSETATPPQRVSENTLRQDVQDLLASRSILAGMPSVPVLRLADITGRPLDPEERKTLALCEKTGLSLGDFDITSVLAARQMFS